MIFFFPFMDKSVDCVVVFPDMKATSPSFLFSFSGEVRSSCNWWSTLNLKYSEKLIVQYRSSNKLLWSFLWLWSWSNMYIGTECCFYRFGGFPVEKVQLMCYLQSINVPLYHIFTRIHAYMTELNVHWTRCATDHWEIQGRENYCSTNYCEQWKNYLLKNFIESP